MATRKRTTRRKVSRKRPTTRKVSRKRPTTRRTPKTERDDAKAGAAVLNVRELGTVTGITYKKKGVKSMYAHQFGRGVKLYATNDGKALIIAPVRVRRGQITG